MSDLLPNLVGLGLLGAGACAAGWFGLRRLARARLVGDTPTSRIRSAAQGFVELNGVLAAHPGGLIQAPLTGHDCVWWRYRIEQYTRNGKNSSWKVIDSGVSGALLVLRDDTGECLVNPAGAEVHASTRDVWQGSRPHPRREPAHTGLIGALLDAGRRYRYTEERLHLGEALYALGDFRTSGGGREGLDLQKGQLEVIREWKQDFQGLLGRFDRNGNGQLDPQEWERVRQAAQREAELRHRQRSRAEPELNLLTQPGQDQPFILSSLGESDLASRLRLQGIGLLLLCLLLSGTLMWSLIRLGLVH